MGPKKGSTHLEQKSPLRNVFKVTTMWHHQRHHLITSCNDIKLHHHKWPPSFYNQRKLLKLFLVIKAYDIIIWHQDDINTSSQVPSKLIQLTNSWLSLLQASNSASKESCSYRTFWEHSARFKEEKWNQLKLWTAAKKRVQQLYFHPWSPRHSSPINTRVFEG